MQISSVVFRVVRIGTSFYRTFGSIGITVNTSIPSFSARINAVRLTTLRVRNITKRYITLLLL